MLQPKHETELLNIVIKSREKDFWTLQFSQLFIIIAPRR